MAQLQLSACTFHRTRSVKLARTIADLAGVDNISPAHLEAIQCLVLLCTFLLLRYLFHFLQRLSGRMIEQDDA